MTPPSPFLELRPVVATLPLTVVSDWPACFADLRETFDAYSTHEESPMFTVMVLRHRPRSALLNKTQFRSGYGWFYEAAWQIEPDPTAYLWVNLSPLRPIRPFIDSEMHRTHEDVGRIIHERLLTTFVQLFRADSMSFVHGASMVDPQGSGWLVTGEGGVGKTSLALELGRRHGWGFLSDDLTVIDITGRMYLNANRPKVYAYNVAGDPALERLLLANRGSLNRLHWYLKKQWPDRVRRSVTPGQLYSRFEQSAPLEQVLLVERRQVNAIRFEQVDSGTLAREMVRVLGNELGKISPDIEKAVAEGRVGRPHRKSITWNTSTWETTILESVGHADLTRVVVPLRMNAIEYRRAMTTWLTSRAP